MGFGVGKGSPVYHYHSNYDSFNWMEKYGDPSFAYHETIAKVWALTAAKLVETPVLQLNAVRYAKGLRKYVESVKEKALESKNALENAQDAFDTLDGAVAHFHFAAAIHDGTAAELLQKVLDNDIPWWKWWEKVKLYYDIRRVNTKYKFLERKFLYKEGLDERPWFKHVVFAPGKWTGYAGATFPGIVEALEEGNKTAANKWIRIATELVNGAADWLEED